MTLSPFRLRCCPEKLMAQGISVSLQMSRPLLLLVPSPQHLPSTPLQAKSLSYHGARLKTALTLKG